MVLFAHSFGATSCSGSSSRLTKKERQEQGLKGGLLGTVYVATALCKDGASQLGLMGLCDVNPGLARLTDQYVRSGGVWPPFCRLNYPSPRLFVFEPAVDLLWNDLEPELQKKLTPTHLPHASSVFETPVTDPLWAEPKLDGRRIYLLTKQDQSFPPELQKHFVAESGVSWDVREVDAGHAAFAGKPEEIAGIIVEAAKIW